MKLLTTLVLCAVSLAAQAQDVAPRPKVVALLAAVGDRIELVMQKRETGSHLEPFDREILPVSSQALNYAALRGLDAAVAEDQPQARRVLLQWVMPAYLADHLQNATGAERRDLVLEAVTHYLAVLPDRQQWDEVELIVPAYRFSPLDGMGKRLSGVGIYVQTVARESVFFNDPAYHEVDRGAADGDYKTVNPNTGETAKSSVYLAPYMYFERLTYDAKSMQLLKSQLFFNNTKYADPQSVEMQIAKQMPSDQLLEKLTQTVEHAAYLSLHPGGVKTSTPKALSAGSTVGG